MISSSSNLVSSQLNDIYNVPGNEAPSKSTTQTEPQECCFKGHKVEKSEPLAIFPGDNLHQPLLEGSNTQLLKATNLLYDRACTGLEHKFDGSEQAFKRTLAIVNAHIGGTSEIDKYFIHEKNWFRYFVDEHHMALFLKKTPNEDDIKELENFVDNINDKLSADQFDETYESVLEALGGRKNNLHFLKRELKNFGPHIFNIYLQLAKQRFAENHATRIIDANRLRENPKNASNNMPDAELATAEESANFSEEMKASNEMKKLRDSFANISAHGIVNPSFTDDDIQSTI